MSVPTPAQPGHSPHLQGLRLLRIDLVGGVGMALRLPRLLEDELTLGHEEQGGIVVGIPLQRALEDRLGLPEAVMSDNTIVFGEPIRPGDELTTTQILYSVSSPKTTKLGTGRFWDFGVRIVNQRGELCAEERYTGFGYNRDAAAKGSK